MRPRMPTPGTLGPTFHRRNGGVLSTGAHPGPSFACPWRDADHEEEERERRLHVKYESAASACKSELLPYG